MASPGVTLVPAPQEEDHPEQLTSLEACVGLPWILTTETPGWTQVINTISKETFGIVLRAELISGVSSLLLCDPRGESPAWHPHVLPAALSTQPQGGRGHLWDSAHPQAATPVRPALPSNRRVDSICAVSRAWLWNPLESVDGPAGAAAAVDRDLWDRTQAGPRALGSHCQLTFVHLCFSGRCLEASSHHLRATLCAKGRCCPRLSATSKDRAHFLPQPMRSENLKTEIGSADHPRALPQSCQGWSDRSCHWVAASEVPR